MNAIRSSLRMLLGKRPPAMQVAAICLDRSSGKVLLISSRGTGRWVVPKGWPMAGRTLHGAAAQEAWEEAGIRGKIRATELGRYRYDKTQDVGFAFPVEVRVFLLEVEHVADDFPEVCQRRREWFFPGQAAELVDERGLQDILRALQGKTACFDAAARCNKDTHDGG
ncbi:NUDIX hydrolase [Paracoccus seriniphilus]|uniref:8-oxo-dGTP pyrophosphatase MutT, NUDIX family n=1 Tax=Paracoccus seriniphilus TaxID=184748 RepID=A0A239PL50_9RHOB|nr:NUDIX hydrolase [Paracoccus seriniphilus]WCR13849.1 NUDIX hydrolase [Paracoccus seriniphilus]SNT68531.1 8-oxo-dGTP pyrophosphatase MutT, NUDIX family [Paracoccus seriniphilus]